MQMQDKQPQSRPPIKMADTPDYIGLYIADMLRMRAQGKSNGEMLSWLRIKRVDANIGDLVAFWKDYDQKQKEQPRQSDTAASKAGSTTSDGEVGPPSEYDPPALWDYAIELVALRDVGKSNDEILAWLRTRRNLDTNATEIAKVLDYHEKYQDELVEELPQSTERDLDEERDQPHEENCPPTASGGITAGIAPNGGPSAGSVENPGPNENTSDTEKPKQPAEEKRPPMASGGISTHTAASFDISAIMDDYKVVVARQAAKDKVTENLDPERDRITQRMIYTLMIYKTSLERREERMMALKIKAEELELKKSKATAAACQEEEEANETVATASPSQKKAPKDFDNTALIQKLHHAAFWDVDALLATGLVDELLVAVENKTKAMGGKVQGYVPPPLGTGLWSKPAPSSVPGPGVPPTPAGTATPSSGTDQQATPEATGAATVATPAEVMARINAFLSALAQRAEVDPSGLAQPEATKALVASVIAAKAAAPAAVAETPATTANPKESLSGKSPATPEALASSHPSGHPPTAQPSPHLGTSMPIIGSPISQQPAKPGPTVAGTAPAINPSG